LLSILPLGLYLDLFLLTSRLIVEGLLSRRSAIWRKLNPSDKKCCRHFRSSMVKCLYGFMLTSVQNVCVVTTFYTLESMKSLFLAKICIFRSRLRLSLQNTNSIILFYLYISTGVALRIIIYPPPSRREAFLNPIITQIGRENKFSADLCRLFLR